MTPKELEEKIGKLNRAIASPATPEASKTSMKALVEKLEKDLAEASKGDADASEKKNSGNGNRKGRADKGTPRPHVVRGKNAQAKKAVPPPAPVKKEVPRTPSGLSEKECEVLLAKVKANRQKEKQRVAKRVASGKPVHKTVSESVRSTVKTVHNKVTQGVKRGKTVTKREAASTAKQIIELAKTIMAGIKNAAERKAFVTQVCSKLTSMAKSGTKFADGGALDYYDNPKMYGVGNFNFAEGGELKKKQA